MIGSVTVGTNDFDKARDYYEALMAELDASQLYARGDFNIMVFVNERARSSACDATKR